LTCPAQTLHDFVLSLLTDDAARSVFGADPSAALAGAGLSDVTPQDVQEVIPLVMDYAPAGLPALPTAGLPALPTAGLPTLPTAGLPALPTLPTAGPAESAIQQLQALANAAGAHSLPHFAAPAAGSFGGTFVGEGSPVGTYAVGLVGSADGVGAAGGISNNSLTAEGGVTGGVHGFAAGGSSHSALGVFNVESTGVPAVALPALPTLPTLPTPGLPGFNSVSDPSSALDSVSAGTVAGYVSSGGDLVAGHLSSGSATLGGYLTDAGGAVAQGGHTAAVQVSEGAHTVAGQLSSLPAAGSLPALPAGIPALPAVPGVPALPAIPGVPSGLPVHLPAGLPTELPHLPVANPLPDLAHSPVQSALGDVASHSPLGDVAAPVHAALPHPVDALTDLHLGH
jgi:hypothetical protein